MTRKEHIAYWLRNSEGDLDRAEMCFDKFDFVFGMLRIHLALEKTLKAVWVDHNTALTPPKTHNLVWLVEQTTVKFSEDDLVFLNDMNRFQLEGRYPDYKNSIYHFTTKEYSFRQFEKTKIIIQCLHANIQNN